MHHYYMELFILSTYEYNRNCNSGKLFNCNNILHSSDNNIILNWWTNSLLFLQVISFDESWWPHNERWLASCHNGHCWNILVLLSWSKSCVRVSRPEASIINMTRVKDNSWIFVSILAVFYINLNSCQFLWISFVHRQ